MPDGLLSDFAFAKAATRESLYFYQMQFRVGIDRLEKAFGWKGCAAGMSRALQQVRY